MEEQQKSIDEIFRQSLGDYREAPPAAAWEEVARRLDADDGSRRRRFFLPWPWMMLALLLIGSGAWFMIAQYGRDKEDQSRMPVAAIVRQQPALPAPLPMPSFDTIHTAASAASPSGNTGSGKTTGGHAATRRHARNNATTAAGNSSTSRHKTIPDTRRSHRTGSRHTYASRPTPDSMATALRNQDNASLSERGMSLQGRNNKATTANGTRTGKALAVRKSQESAHRQSIHKQIPAKQTAANDATANTNNPANQPAASMATAPDQSSDIAKKKTVSAATGRMANRLNGNTANRPADKQQAAIENTAHSNTKAQAMAAALGKATTRRKKPRPETAITGQDSPVATPIAINKPQSRQTRQTKRPTSKREQAAIENPQVVTTPAQPEQLALPSTEQATAAEKHLAKKNSAKAQRRSPANDVPAPPAVASDPINAKNSAVEGPTSAVTKEKRSQKRSTSQSAAARPKSVNGQTTTTKAKPAASAAQNSLMQPGGQVPAATAIKTSKPDRAATNKKTAVPFKPATAAKKTIDTPKSITAGRNTFAAKPSLAKNRKLPPEAPATFSRNDLPVSKPVIATPKGLKPEKPEPNPAKEQTAGKPDLAKATPQPVPEAAANTSKKATATEAGDEEDNTDDAAEEGEGNKGGGGGGGGGAAATKPKRKTSVSLAALVGYEFAQQTPASNRVTGAIRLLWHFDPGIAIGLQPSYRYGSVSSTTLGPEQIFQQSVTRVDSVLTRDTGNRVIRRRYDLTQTFDSFFVAGSSAGGAFWEIELPLILSYRLSSAWRLYGGASLNFGGTLSTAAGAQRKTTTILTDSIGQAGAIPVAELLNHFPLSPLPEYSTYRPANAALGTPASMRWGYLFGLGYEWRRILFDASVHQQVSGYNDVAPAVQKAYASPYIRLSLGYYLLPQKNTRRTPAE